MINIYVQQVSWRDGSDIIINDKGKVIRAKVYPTIGSDKDRNLKSLTNRIDWKNIPEDQSYYVLSYIGPEEDIIDPTLDDSFDVTNPTKYLLSQNTNPQIGGRAVLLLEDIANNLHRVFDIGPIADIREGVQQNEILLTNKSIKTLYQPESLGYLHKLDKIIETN